MNYNLEAPFGNPHGKLSKKNCKIIWAENKVGTRFTQVRYRSPQEATAAQISQKNKFKQTVAQVNTIMTDMDLLQPYRSQWKNAIKSGNTKYKTLRGYIFAKVYSTI